ncbi:MAG: hypothetical protein QOJ76_65 [Acidobacteriota bacterium]|jgi:hypothetical protein|nr:hypothetical protein [Acidobacteriota bacterium]
MHIRLSVRRHTYDMLPAAVYLEAVTRTPRSFAVVVKGLHHTVSPFTRGG